MKQPKPKPFDVKLSDTARQRLTDDLCREIEDAVSARSAMIADGGLIDLFDWFYEQGRSQPGDRPFPGAADLTSYFITENVDALKARLMRANFGVEPFCAVEAWGQDASKAPFVEAFHEWKVQEEGLQGELAKVALGGLLEDAFILEVRPKVETKRTVEVMAAALELTEDGAPVMTADGPKYQRDEFGELVPAQSGEPSAEVEVTQTKTRHLGPEYDCISMKDYLFLPSHAKNMRQVWGGAKRFWERVPELQEAVQDGMYDKAAVALVGDASDRETGAGPSVAANVAPQEGPSVEKELWELSLKRDLDGDGREEWYLVTLSVRHRTILRLKRDPFLQKVGRSRCVPFVLFPRRDSVTGYTYAEKLLTLAEEHTALRNMIADRSALATSAPIQVLQGGLWDPRAEPFGVGSIITVRDHNEIKPLTIPDVPQSVIFLLRDIFGAKERVGGLSDMSIGTQAADDRTLGENEMVATGSAIRVEEILGYFREGIEAVMQLRHAIWEEALKADPRGVEAPSDVLDSIAARGLEAPESGRFTAEAISGKFRFKPNGSVETADSSRRIAYFTQGLVALGNLAQLNPMFQAILSDPDVARTILQEWARVYKVRNANVFLKAFQQLVLQAQQQQQMQSQMGMPPGAPALPPGQPGAGGGIPPELLAIMQSLGTGGAAGVN